ARTYGEYIRGETGQNVTVENKADASGSVAAVEAKRAAPDGYTLMFTISTTMIMNRVLIKDIAYDADKDFFLVSIMPSGARPCAAREKQSARPLAGGRGGGDRLLRRIDRRGPRQLLRGVVRVAERPRPCRRRLAQAHVD